MALAASIASCSHASSAAPAKCGDEDAAIEGDRRLDLEYPELVSCQGAEPVRSVRIATWNIRAGREKGLRAVAHMLEELDSDVVLLQEVDNEVLRTGCVAELATLASELRYAFVSVPTIPLGGGTYGLGILSRLPVQNVREIQLSNQHAAEPRKAVVVDLCAGETTIRVVNHHADYVKQAAARSLSEILAAINLSEGTIVLGGDFNQTPTEAGVVACRRAGLADVLAVFDPSPTFGSRRIDYLFADSETAKRVAWAQVVPTSASDHHPVVMEIGAEAAW